MQTYLTSNIQHLTSKIKMAKRITMRQAISDALREEMIRDENVFIMGEEIGVWGGTYAVTRGFYDEFGENRVRDTPISEMVIGGAATGAAMNGLRPVAEIQFMGFVYPTIDQIVNHAGRLRRLPEFVDDA